MPSGTTSCSTRVSRIDDMLSFAGLVARDPAGSIKTYQIEATPERSVGGNAVLIPTDQRREHEGDPRHLPGRAAARRCAASQVADPTVGPTDTTVATATTVTPSTAAATTAAPTTAIGAGQVPSTIPERPSRRPQLPSPPAPPPARPLRRPTRSPFRRHQPGEHHQRHRPGQERHLLSPVRQATPRARRSGQVRTRAEGSAIVEGPATVVNAAPDLARRRCAPRRVGLGGDDHELVEGSGGGGVGVAVDGGPAVAQQHRRSCVPAGCAPSCTRRDLQRAGEVGGAEAAQRQHVGDDAVARASVESWLLATTTSLPNASTL